MATITFQVLDGVDRGRVFRHLVTPLTLGREEGNQLRLNDERVSRFHAKIQHDNGDFVLTDLESTNGTRVNGHVVQIRRLRLGDQVNVGRSTLLFGSNEEIEAYMAEQGSRSKQSLQKTASNTQNPLATLASQSILPENEFDFDLNVDDEVTIADGDLFIGTRPLPPLPQKMSPAQAARFAEVLDFLHRGITQAAENVQIGQEGNPIHLTYNDWQKIQAVQMLLARYLRAVAEPET